MQISFGLQEVQVALAEYLQKRGIKCCPDDVAVVDDKDKFLAIDNIYAFVDLSKGGK